jgi:hypothetical protein
LLVLRLGTGSALEKLGLSYFLRRPRSTSRRSRKSEDSAGKRFEDCGQRVLCLCTHFIVGCILNWVRHENVARLRHAECVALEICRLIKLGRRYGDRWDSLDFKPDCVVQTARRTGTSVSQRFDQIIYLARNIAPHIVRARLGERGLGKPHDGYTRRGCLQLALKFIKQHISAGLADIQKPDCAAQRARSGRYLPGDGLSLIGRVKDCCHLASFFCSGFV